MASRSADKVAFRVLDGVLLPVALVLLLTLALNFQYFDHVTSPVMHRCMHLLCGAVNVVLGPLCKGGSTL